METTNNRRWHQSDLFHVALIMAAALVIGVYLIVTCVLVNPDGVFYIGRARELAQTPLRAISTFPPGYPALLLVGHKVAGLFGKADSSMAWIYSSQAVTLLSRILALACLYFVGKLLVGARRSFWAVLLLTFLPYPAEFGSNTLREWPYLLCVIGAIWLLLWSLRTKRWWGFAFVGLVTGLGYLVRPESAQVLVYAMLGLIVGTRQRAVHRGAALAVLVIGFLVTASPYLLGSRTVVPYQLTQIPHDRPPVITSVGDRSTGPQPMEFDVAAGESLEVAVDASDPEGNEVTLSVAAIPAGSRPVYQFEAVKADNSYLTLSETEKDVLIAEHVPKDYRYVGIAFYAWPNGNGSTQLKPVYGFWLSEPIWHIFTLNEPERQTLLGEIQGNRGVGDYVAFYAYAPDDHPPDATAFYRYRDSAGAPHWASDVPANAASRQPEPAWYAYAPAEPPAGLSLADHIIRWQPTGEQRGTHLLNLVASDGQFQTCQFLRINVDGATETVPSREVAPPNEVSPLSQAAPSIIQRGAPPTEARRAKAHLWDALYETGGAFSENMMYLLLIPLALGLYRFLKDEAGPFERALTAAIIVVNLTIMVARYMLVEPGPHRRYCQVLVVFSMLHVPAGGQIMAHWIHTGIGWLRRGRFRAGLSERGWFYVLVALALGPLCLPKMISPMDVEKRNYRQVIDWLRENTRPADIVAAPDARIGFYAERPGPVYVGSPDPQSGDYIVTITPRGTQESVPADWQKLYSPPPARNAPDRVTVYRPAPNGR